MWDVGLRLSEQQIQESGDDVGVEMLKVKWDVEGELRTEGWGEREDILK